MGEVVPSSWSVQVRTRLSSIESQPKKVVVVVFIIVVVVDPKT